MFRIPMIFPGQASQSVGMARDLFERDGAASEFLRGVDDAVGEGLTTTMFEGPQETLTETHRAQPAILAHSVATALALREIGILPEIVAGHSLGEFSAAVVAGVIDPITAVKIVRKRGELMFEAGRLRPGTMAAVLGLTAAEVDTVCRRVASEVGVVCLANHNSAVQVAISGEIDAVRVAGEQLLAAGAKRVIPLQVSGAFHSPLLADAAVEFAAVLQGAAFAEPGVPLVANVSAEAAVAADQVRTGMKRQLTAPVLWQDSLEGIASGSFTGIKPRIVLEVGPGRVLSNLARRAYPEVRFLPVGTGEDLDNVLDIVTEILR